MSRVQQLVAVWRFDMFILAQFILASFVENWFSIFQLNNETILEFIDSMFVHSCSHRNMFAKCVQQFGNISFNICTKSASISGSIHKLIPSGFLSRIFQPLIIIDIDVTKFPIQIRTFASHFTFTEVKYWIW